jgi:hypothetical protein
MSCLHAERFTQLDVHIREHHLEAQQVLHALLEGQRHMIDGERLLSEELRALIEGQRLMVDGQRSLSDDLRALIARIDALIRGRGDGNPAA